MMSCKETMARLTTFLDRELSTEEVVEVRTHLDACPPCQNYFKFEGKLKMLVHQHACVEQAPLSLRERICQKIRQL